MLAMLGRKAVLVCWLHTTIHALACLKVNVSIPVKVWLDDGATTAITVTGNAELNF